MNRRTRLGVGACLVVLALLAGWMTWAASSTGPSGRAPATGTLPPGATRPAGQTVSDLESVEQLQARFNADQGAPRLVLALAPT
jgi:hypothetical protein